MINAVSHNINPMGGEEPPLVEANPPEGAQFENTLDGLMLQQSLENPGLEELMLQEDATATLEDLLEAGELNGSAVPFTPELAARQTTGAEISGTPAQTPNSGLSRMAVLQKTAPLKEEKIVLAEQRTDTRNPHLLETPGGLRNPAGTVLSLEGSRSDADGRSELPEFLAQSVLQRGETLEKDALSRNEQLQAALRPARSAGLESDAQETMDEQMLNAGLIKPGEQAQTTVTRAPLASMASIGSKETLTAFETPPALEPVAALETGFAKQSLQPQGLTKADSLHAAQSDVSAIELPFDVEQVISRVRVLRDQDTQQITLRLQPDHLGRVTMKVRQSGGELRVDMQVDNPMAKQIIESGFDHLRSRFLDREFAFQELSLNIDVNQQSAYQNERDAQNPRFDQEFAQVSRGVAGEEEVPEPTAPVPRRGSETGLNLYV